MAFRVSKDNVTAVLDFYLRGDLYDMEDSKQELAEKITDTCGIDLTIWGIENIAIVANAWTVNGKFGSKDDYHWDEALNKQLKITIRYKRIAPDNKYDFKEDLISTIKAHAPKVDLIEYPGITGNLLLNDIPDHHLSRLSWGKETGDSYDINIAVRRYRDANQYFHEESKYISHRHPIERQLFVLGNDYFNYDYAKPYPQTSNGTPQTSDVRFQKMFSIGSHVAIKEIETASMLSPITVIIIPGNHDEMMAFMLGEVVAAWFHNNPNVEVITSPNLRKYYPFGKTLLGFSHGQYETFERLFANMAFEDMVAWANTEFKFMFTGHLHHKEVKIKLGDKDIIGSSVRYPKKPVTVTEDLNGIIFDRLASLSSNDYYESSRGYIHVKQAEAQLFSREYGKLMSFVYQLPLSIHSSINQNQ